MMKKGLTISIYGYNIKIEITVDGNFERDQHMAWMVWDYPEPAEETPEPRCPVCGEVCGTVYRDRYFEIVGCDECVMAHDAGETEECFLPR